MKNKGKVTVTNEIETYTLLLGQSSCGLRKSGKRPQLIKIEITGDFDYVQFLKLLEWLNKMS